MRFSFCKDTHFFLVVTREGKILFCSIKPKRNRIVPVPNETKEKNKTNQSSFVEGE